MNGILDKSRIRCSCCHPPTHLLVSDLPEDPPHDLPAAGLGQRRCPVDLFRNSNRPDNLADLNAQGLLELRGSRVGVGVLKTIRNRNCSSESYVIPYRLPTK